MIAKYDNLWMNDNVKLTKSHVFLFFFLETSHGNITSWNGYNKTDMYTLMSIVTIN